MPSLDPDFAWLINHAIARDPEHRFASAQEFAEALDDWMRKNALTGTLSLPRPSDAFPTRTEPVRSKTSATLSLDGEIEVIELGKTGNEELWAHSKGETTANLRRKKRRMPRIAAASLGGLVAVGLGIALMVRADPAPVVAHVGPAATASAATALPRSASLDALAAARDTGVATEPTASGAPSATASTAQHEPGKALATTHAAPPAADKPRPKAAASAKGFDLGY